MLSSMARRPTTDRRQQLRIEAGRRVSVLRSARNLTQKGLAQAAGLPQSTMSNVESGARGMPPDQRVAIAAALGVDAATLDPSLTPDLDIEKYALAVWTSRGTTERPMSDPPANLPTKLPPGLEGYLERHPDISPRIRWYLENSSFRTEPWVKFDDDFWEEVAVFWERYLHQKEGAGGRGTKGGGTPPKG